MDDKKYTELLEKLNLAEARLIDLEKRVDMLERSEKNTGVYLEGAPEYVKDYISQDTKKDEKVGE